MVRKTLFHFGLKMSQALMLFLVLVMKPVPEQEVHQDQGAIMTSGISANEKSLPLRSFVVRRLCAGWKSRPDQLKSKPRSGMQRVILN